MKPRQLKKLVFNKKTVSNLSETDLNLLRGGTDSEQCETEFPCIDPTQEGWTCKYPQTTCWYICELP